MDKDQLIEHVLLAQIMLLLVNKFLKFNNVVVDIIMLLIDVLLVIVWLDVLVLDVMLWQLLVHLLELVL